MATLATFGRLIPTQEVSVTTSKHRVFQFWFEKHSTEFQVTGQAWDRSQGWAAINLTMLSGKDSYSIYNKLFDMLVPALKKQQESILEVDNPCNAEFISIQKQAAYRTTSGVQYILKLNGKVV